jgi:hypothetical protein
MTGIRGCWPLLDVALVLGHQQGAQGPETDTPRSAACNYGAGDGVRRLRRSHFSLHLKRSVIIASVGQGPSPAGGHMEHLA